MDQVASLRDLATAMDAGQVDLLVILGSNPVFTAPADLKFQERLAKVPLSVSHTLYPDETSMLLPLEPARGARPRELGRRARLRRHRHGHAAADRAALRRADDAGSARRVHRRAERQVQPRSREGLLDARAGRQGRQLRDHRRDRPAVQERGQLLEARAARRVDSGNGAGRRSRHRRPGTLPAPPPLLGFSTCRRRCPGPIPDPRPPASSGGSGDHLPARPHDLGRPLRQQRLAAGAAEAADEDHVGPDGVGQPAARASSRASATATSSSSSTAATPRSCR